ncbi:MAG: SEC-C domain-containing protein [Planctomycetes bacterium]|nr:SEC-C domain-containing protein [Planctomycetota bacterium]
MSKKNVALALADFCDSTFARSSRVPAADARRIAEHLFELCWEGLGKEPRFLDAEDVRTLFTQLLPGRFARKDPLAEHVPAIAEAFIAQVAASSVMMQRFEVEQALPAAIDEFLSIVRRGANAPTATAKKDPFVHGASKLGRNDPCSCGSGKKFKKCHGQDA